MRQARDKRSSHPLKEALIQHDALETAARSTPEPQIEISYGPLYLSPPPRSINPSWNNQDLLTWVSEFSSRANNDPAAVVRSFARGGPSGRADRATYRQVANETPPNLLTFRYTTPSNRRRRGRRRR